MIANPDLVRYACIAHHPSFESSTILAEFNSADSNLQQLAQQCLQLVPPHHYIFSHSYCNQSYTFLLHNGFVYFGIFDSNMVKSDQILFLGRLKEAIDRLTINGKSNYKFSSYCLQGELHPIFHKLMSKSFDFDSLPLTSNGDHNNKNPASNSSKSKKILSVSFISASKIGKGLKKKKMSEESLTNSRDSLVDGHVSLPHVDDCDAGEVKSREIIHTNNESFFMDNNNNNNNGVGRHNKAKKIWRRHVWIVLMLDLAVCLILFGIWLFVCHGFECIGG